MKNRLKLSTSLHVLILLWIGLPAFAQITGGEIFGSVTDGAQSALPGVVITIEGEKMLSKRSVISDADGKYRFLLLPLGEYSLTFVMPGFLTVKTCEVQVRTGQKTKYDQVMETASVEETITVVAERPLIDSSTTDSKFEFDTSVLENIPTLSRSVEDVVKFTPGVTGVRMDTVNGGEGGLPNIRGAGQEGNQYMVDGLSSRGSMNFTNVVPQNFDSIDSLEVISDPFSPEYGKAMGGAINIVTKSGGNTFFGEVGFQFRDDTLEADREPVQASNTTTGFERNKMWTNFGGYIVKDKLWFFVSYNRNEPINLSAGASPRILSEENLINLDGSAYGSDYTVYEYLDGENKSTTDQVFYKFTYNINQNQNIAFSGTNMQLDNTNTTGHQDLWAAVKTDASRFRLNYNLLLGTFGSLELKVGTQDSELDVGGYTDRSLAQRYINTIAWSFGNRRRFDNQVEKRTDVSAKFVGFLDTESFGTHEFSLGVEWESFETSWLRGNTGWGEDVFDDTFNEGTDFQFQYETNENGQIILDAGGNPILTPVLLTERRNSLNNNKVRGNGLYIQDRITLGNLTLMAGVRTDANSVYNDAGNAIWKWDYSDYISPRLSVIYDLFGDQRHVVKGAYGIFKDATTTRIGEAFNTRGGNAFRIYTWEGGSNPSEAELHDTANWVFNHEQSAETTGMQFDPGLKPNKNIRWLLEYNFRISNHHALTARYTNLQARDLLEDVGVMVDGQLKFFLDNYEDKKRDYESVDLILKGKVSNWLDYTFSYTWTDSRGTNPGNFENATLNVPGGSGSYVGVFGDHVQTDGSDVGDYVDWATAGLGGRGYGDEGWYGKLSDSVDNAINFIGNFHLPWNVELSSAMQYIDGYFYAKKGLQPIYQSYFVFLEGRGSRQTPSTYWLDLSLSKSMQLANRHNISFRLDMFNVTDQQEGISMVEEDTVDFGKIYRRQNPQAFQLGVHYKF